jgi:3'-phosphoadenosine 5'-phosphosulfate sulfotransferase (PAPS reductase)/FAD synthetase
MDLREYDIILVNTSAGKDSQAMLDHVYELAAEQGVTERLHAVHCDLGRVEWAGTKELAERQCARYGVPLHIVKRPQGDLLAHVEERGKWMGPNTRYCTSQHKTGQVSVLMTKLVAEFNTRHQAHIRPKSRRRVTILNCLGLRAQESPKRRDMEPFGPDAATNETVRRVDRWLPIHAWSEDQVWDRIRSRGLEYHKAYDLGMPRLSCVFCIFAPAEALKLAGYHNPELLNAYVQVEARISHSFKHKEPLVQIQAALQGGWQPTGRIDGAAWAQCA